MAEKTKSSAKARKPLVKPADSGPVLLSGGNPQIAKGYGDGPVQAWLDAVPGWKQDVCRRIDAIVADDGVGFQVEATPPGLGLGNMRDRIAAVGGAIWTKNADGELVRAYQVNLPETGLNDTTAPPRPPPAPTPATPRLSGGAPKTRDKPPPRHPPLQVSPTSC